jgi:hypothetical protein
MKAQTGKLVWDFPQGERTWDWAHLSDDDPDRPSERWLVPYHRRVIVGSSQLVKGSDGREVAVPVQPPADLVDRKTETGILLPLWLVALLCACGPIAYWRSARRTRAAFAVLPSGRGGVPGPA